MIASFVRRGRSVLEADPEPRGPSKHRKHVITIFYRSEGDEILRTDTAPLTWQAAAALEAQLKKSSALGWLRGGRFRPALGLSVGVPFDTRAVVFPSEVLDEQA